jgi:hypothetical protein
LNGFEKENNGELIYFICGHKDERFRTKESIPGLFLRRLFVLMPGLVRHAMADFERMGDAIATSAATLWTIFENTF